MLKRKIEEELIAWKNDSNRKPLVIKGCRQCGKTFIVQKFAEENYANVVYLNFMQDSDYALAFEGSKRVDDIVMNLSAMIPQSQFVANETCIIIDEIQECPAARTALKFFKMDGRYDIIATGSLLGVKGYGERRNSSGNESSKTSIPVGYETIIDMYPLDFEEFLWANGISEAIIGKLTECLDSIQPVPEAIHQKMRQLILQYTVVGGMPSVVNTFVNTHNMGRVLAEQRGIVAEYEEDMVKYASDADKPRIRECFESIPRQLSKEYKKFQYSTIRKGAKASQYTGSIQWIEDAGIITRCRNLTITELPLNGNAIDDCFKIYMADTGLFVSMLDDGTQFDIMQGNLHAYKGAIFENLVADIFTKMKRRLYYFRKDSGLEVDFVTRYKGECVLVEVKAKDGNIKSSKTILSHPEKYHVNHAIKLGDLNIGNSGQFLTLPLYMTFLLRQL
ncbi:ATP-binding protein [uncultured Prevotella sp.]|uniref:ATP-binding protein n=1 Tax=uncultured Prevotella sp. TaxID=159272 RepID=UPI00261DB11E|nr:ATP-binding protein [uncultured Prevotella sp.]